MVERSLNIHGDEILYIGDHIYTDVNQSKVHMGWRTALICRELEDEVSTISWHNNFFYYSLWSIKFRYLTQFLFYVVNHVYYTEMLSKTENFFALYQMLQIQYSALIHSRSCRQSLLELINQKEAVGDIFNQLQLTLQRRSKRLNAKVSFVLYFLKVWFNDRMT